MDNAKGSAQAAKLYQGAGGKILLSSSDIREDRVLGREARKVSVEDSPRATRGMPVVARRGAWYHAIQPVPKFHQLVCESMSF